MNWTKQLIDWAVIAAEDAVREKMRRKLQGVNDVLDRINEVTKSAAPCPSNPWPEWYTSAVTAPAPPLDATARAVFAAREEERRRNAEKQAEMLMRHINSMHDAMMNIIRS